MRVPAGTGLTIERLGPALQSPGFHMLIVPVMGNVYRFDGSGNILEHYSDGDLVNEDTPMTRNAAAPDTLHVWGPNM